MSHFDEFVEDYISTEGQKILSKLGIHSDSTAKNVGVEKMRQAGVPEGDIQEIVRTSSVAIPTFESKASKDRLGEVREFIKSEGYFPNALNYVEQGWADPHMDSQCGECPTIGACPLSGQRVDCDRSCYTMQLRDWIIMLKEGRVKCLTKL